MELQIVLLAAVIGYLLGSISFARVIMRVVAPGQELKGIEYENAAGERVQVEAIGGTAVSTKLGAKYGGLTAILDILKVAVPTLAFKVAYPETYYLLIVATMGLVGHNWPLYHRFKGGRGLSAMYGGFLAVDLVGALVAAFAGMFLGLVVVRNVLLSYLAGPWLMVPWFWFRTHDPVYVAYAIVVNAIFVLAMIPELQTVRSNRRRGVQSDMAADMEATPMGSMIRKMGMRLKLFRDE